MLKVSKLTKKFGNKTVVDDVSFEIKPGEIFSLIGPNGSGKTTIIKLIAGLLRPTSGEVVVGGLDSRAHPQEAKMLQGYIPDEPVIWSGMTGGEFMDFTGGLYSVSAKDRLERMPDLLKIFSLQGMEHEFFDSYSRGNKQKFSILAALSHHPKLLLIDEPIVGLDPGSAEIAKKRFAEFAAQGGAVLLVTHTLAVAESLASSIGVLKQGKLVASGSMPMLRDRAKLTSQSSLEQVYQALV